MRSHVLKPWAGDDASMQIRMLRNIRGRRTLAFPQAPDTTTPANMPWCLGPGPAQVKRVRTKTCDRIDFNLQHHILWYHCTAEQSGAEQS